MQLSLEDDLRLNVLLTQKLYAVRIDDSKMCLYALTEKGEAKIELNPTVTDEAYIKEIKSLLSSHVMGSPCGYPLYIKRWTRMGQARDESLEKLLQLGEPEAVVAVVHANGLTDELARRAWWAMPNAENARQMLEKKTVVQGNTGKILAEFLLEFLPFEAEPSQIIAATRLVLQADLISQKQKHLLWQKAKTKKSIYVGFLLSCADDLPIDVAEHKQYLAIKPLLKPLINNNAYADLMDKILSAQGQAFLTTVTQALKKPINQDVVVLLMGAIANYFERVLPQNFTINTMEEIIKQSQSWVKNDHAKIKVLLTALKKNELLHHENMTEKLSAMISLSCVDGHLFTPIFSKSDAIGSVMRKKIKPITDEIFLQISSLIK